MSPHLNFFVECYPLKSVRVLLLSWDDVECAKEQLEAEELMEGK